MKLELVARILDGIAGVRKDGGGWQIPDGLEVSAFFALPSELLAVQRCARLEPSGEVLAIETHKGERFYFPLELLAGLKSATVERATGNRGAGFR